MFSKNRKMNFLGGKSDRSASKTSGSSSSAEAIGQKQSTQFQKLQIQQKENDYLLDLSNNSNQHGPSHTSSLSNTPSLASCKSLPPDPDSNNSNKQDEGLPPQASVPSDKIVTRLSVNTAITPKPRLLRSSVNDNQISKISEKFNRSLDDNKELKQKLEMKRQEAERIEKEYLDHLRTIRAVDDDYSTINDRLIKLHTKINQFLMGVKGRIADPTRATHVFLNIKGWEHIKPAIQHLVKTNEVPLGVTLTQLAEKFIIEEICRGVYGAPIYIGMSQNYAFAEVRHFMEGYGNWAVRLRQQLCTIADKAIKDTSEENEIYKASEAAKTRLVARILDILSVVYAPSAVKELEVRLKLYVDEAASLSLAMHSSPNVIRPMNLMEGQDKADPKKIDVRFNRTVENGTVQIVVCPPFIYLEEGTLNILTKGKAITF